MDELGVDRTLMFPTLASLLEERMRDDPELLHAVVHALNEWMYETWQFDYEGRIFSTPVITLPIVERAIEELEWCLERGARTVLTTHGRSDELVRYLNEEEGIEARALSTLYGGEGD